jgi:NADH-quinone oxidoreductase subunit L
MVVLAILAVVSGLWNVTGQFGAFMGHGETHSFAAGFFGILTHPLPWISLIAAGSGILLAYAMYSAKWLSAERIGSLFKPLYTLFYRKYWFDELYENIIVKVLLLKGLFAGFQVFDDNAVDGAVNGVANVTIAGGRAIRKTQTGQLQLYGLVMGIGVLAIVLCLYFFG